MIIFTRKRVEYWIKTLNPNISFCDADMLFSGRELFEHGYRENEQEKIFFPICFHLSDPSHQLGFWRRSGYGLSFMKKNFFLKYNYQLSEYDALGNEDDDIWDFFHKKHLCVRYEVENYYHQWHPESVEFKNKYYKNFDVHKKKVFINLIPNDYHNWIRNNKSKLKDFIQEDEYYLVNQLEKFTDIVIQIPDHELKTLHSVSEIDEYKKKFNKKLKIITFKVDTSMRLSDEIKKEMENELQTQIRNNPTSDQPENQIPNDFD